MTTLRNRPRLQFTFTPIGRLCEAHLLRGYFVFAKGIIQVKTSTGPKRFPLRVLVKRGEDLHAALDFRVQRRAWAMGWAPTV